MPDFPERLDGCWLGKAIGGSLGQSFEGMDGPLNATFYQPVPTGMVPNDDLDLQVLWAVVLDGLTDVVVRSDILADAWLRHVQFPFGEYGVAKRNLREGLRAPWSGSYDNWFTCGEGAAIRSELWACLAPGDPERAARYAYEDACVDHAGDGIHAAMFLAAMQAMAFAGADLDVMLECGLRAVPAGSGIHAVVAATREWVKEGLGWLDVRSRILDRFGVEDFTDVRMNTGFVVLGLLAGECDFERSILITNNCGKDTDSSTATVGATLGILVPNHIPGRWREPVGDQLVLNAGIVDIDAPGTIQEFSELILELRSRISMHPMPARAETTPKESLPPIVVAAAFYGGTEQLRHGWFMPGPSDSCPSWPCTPHHRELPGTWVRMKAEEFADEYLMLRYRVAIPTSQSVRIMVAATTWCRVWFDQQWLFGRDGGPMFPTPHMPHLNTYADIPGAAGAHELTVVLRRPLVGVTCEWITAIANADTKEWIPNALRGLDAG